MPREARYLEIANDLRRRLAAGEFPVGAKLPTISDLQEEYEVPGLNTIRSAQSVLVKEGLIEPLQGKGVFVTAIPVSGPREDLVEIRELLAQAQRALERLGSKVG